MPEMHQNVKINDSAKVANKEENAASHQIANLLLNLASRSHQQTRRDPEKSAEPEAMDLSKYRKPKLPVDKVAAAPKAPSGNFYSGLGLGSPFLLQNLLMQQMTTAPAVGQQAATTTIPLMAGQIVAQLNSLLFVVHGVQDKGVEMNVRGQLGAIYTRLQEIVTMIQHAKKQEPIRSAKLKEPAQPSHSELHKQLEMVTSTKEKEEQRISAQLEEYQRALSCATTPPTPCQYPATSPISSSVATSIRKHKSSVSEVKEPVEALIKVEDTVASRRGSRDSLDDGPPEKCAKMDDGASSPGSSPSSVSRSRGGGGGKSGKGIRNRVFCGDCAGCLKNDDCGNCRYCRDKTKFGGQNRLRQKCLHRRCLLDTHRRSGNGAQSSGQGEPGIYSGLELARLQHSTPGDHSIFSLLGGSAARVPTATSEEGEGREEREESKEREGEQAQSRSDRWKAKHEAMLKQAEEAKNGTQQVFESSNLVITLNESTRREEGESEALQRKILSSGSAESGPDAARLTRQSLKTVMAV